MKELFLTMLATRSAYGYELRQTLEHAFGQMLPAMNAGQIYSTLARLERDGVVRGVDVPEDARGKRVYEITDKGRNELDAWIATPVPGGRLKNEFFMKFVMLVWARLAPPNDLIDGQRREYLRSLRSLDELLDADPQDPTIELLVEGAILHLKADLEWLDMMQRRWTEMEGAR
jgi:DNA-binding PadR family transcriptional regulator